MRSISARFAFRLSLACALLLVVSSMHAAGQGGAVDTRVASTAHVDDEMLRGLQYRMIGPHRGGRSTAVVGVPGDHRTFYMGATGGGVWKTTDAGEVWENVSDGYFKTGAVGAIAVATSDPKTIYAGTGSASIRNNIEIGHGSYKSTDGGVTWSPVGLEDAGQIAKIRVDPRDANRVYVAAVGHAFGPNAERGIFRSKDGGKTWEKVLFVNDHTGAVDLVMSGQNPEVMYAAMWTGARQPWGMVAGSKDGGVFKTSDGGDHWTKLSHGLPQGPVGKIGIAVSPANPSRVWALVDAGAEGGLFRSDDAGESFSRINQARALLGRSWYYGHLFADTKDPEMLYAANTDFFRSKDGGKSFEPIPMPHGDNHDLWIDPKDPEIMIEANDGGATISVNGGGSWSTELNQPTAEIYRVVADDQVPYRVYGTQQDQYDGLSLPSRSAHFGERMQLQHWYAIGGMEGGYVGVVPHNPDIVYSGGPGGMTTRIDLKEQHLRSINVTAGARGGNLRFAWSSPIFISPLEPDAVYHTSNFVHKTSDGGQTWKTISPDLTRNDKKHQGVGNGPGSEAEVYPTVSAFAESPRTRGVLWAGSDDGLVHLSRDGGLHWADVTPKGMPDFATVNTIEPSPHDPARAFAAVFRYMLDDYHPYIYRTDDFGNHWTLLTDGNGIPADQPVRVVREDPVRKGLLYAGTEYGVFASFDDGKHWQSLQLNLPAVPITDIVVHDSDLALSTNGRSFWILDDISPLRQMAVQPIAAPHLFPARATYRIATSADEDDQPYIGGACCVSNVRDLYAGARIERHQLGTEPPEGAILYASFPTQPKERVMLTISDASGKLLRTLVDTNVTGGPTVAAGLNRYNWDLNVEPRAPGTAKPAQRGPKAVPGIYQVHLTVGDKTQTATLKLMGDPKAGLTAQAYQSQFDLLMHLQEAMAQIREAGATIKTRRAGLSNGDPELERLNALELRLGSTEAGGRGGRGAAAGSVPPLLGEFNSLYTFVSGSEDRPTGGATDRYLILRKSLDDDLGQLRARQ